MTVSLEDQRWPAMSCPQNLTVLQLAERLARGEPLAVLDVRQPDERTFCAIPVPSTALDVHVPLGDLTSRLEEVVSACASGPVVVYCHHGVRSLAAASWLAGQGLRDVVNLEGGIDAWSRMVDPDVPRY
jgi:rhodanese-related sulfurtransferase